MKLILPVFFIFSLIVNLPGQRFDIKFLMEGHLRECIIVKPTTAPPPGGYPVVFMLHGTSGDGEKFFNISGWKELGQQENFITVFPSSLSWCYVKDGVEEHNTRWVNGNVTDYPCSGPPQNYVDDIKFLKKLVSIIVDTLPVNSSKIFASGFSNGCSMIHKIAIDAGDVFAAVAGSSSPLAEGDSIIPPVHRIPVWFMLGTLDDRFFFNNYTEIPFGRDTVLAYMGKSLNRALACQGLSQSFIFNETPISHTYIFNESQGGGLSASPYLFTLNKGQTHEYPNGSNYPVDAPKLFWEFFKKATVVSTKSESEITDQITLYPNPSSSQIHVGIKTGISSFNIKIMNCLGQTVYQEEDKSDINFTIDKSKTGSGLFLLQIQLGGKIISKKILFE